MYENKQRAGATTERFKDAQCLYLAICIEDNVYGVIAIPVDEYTLDSFEYSILLSVINECALAMENSTKCNRKRKKCDFSKKRTASCRSFTGNFP